MALDLEVPDPHPILFHTLLQTTAVHAVDPDSSVNSETVMNFLFFKSLL